MPRTIRGPSCLAVPDLDSVNGPRKLLDVSNSLLQIIKIGRRRVGYFLSLPVGKRIYKA